MAYKCSETEGGRLETGREREREREFEMQTNRKRRADGGLDEPKADKGEKGVADAT